MEAGTMVIRTLLVVLILSVTSICAPYSGGSGTAEDPFQIHTAEDLMLLGDSPEHYDKHFFLTADINLDPNLPGRKVFDRAVIAPDTNDVHWRFQGIPFTGVFDGQGHKIHKLHIEGSSHLGLFGQLGRSAQITDLSLEAMDVKGTGGYVGGFVGINHGRISNCYSTGTIMGDNDVGGLVGLNYGDITRSYSTAAVSGGNSTGGLVGRNNSGQIATSYSTGSVRGNGRVGGLVGENNSIIVACYSTGAVTGNSHVGGLVGEYDWDGIITSSIWDMETSGLTFSDGGFGLTTAEMMDPYMLGLIGFANDPNWILDAGRDYPRLVWEGTAGQIIPESIIDWLDGQGTAAEPYRIATADQLILLSRTSVLWDKHFILGADIDLDSNLQDRQVLPQVVIRVFSGVFDGNDHTISHLTISGGSCLGLFGQLASGASISNLGLEAVDVCGTGNYIGGLVGKNLGGNISNCFSNGIVNGKSYVGGLVGRNEGNITTSCSTSTVTGNQSNIGGLVGFNGYVGNIAASYSTGTIIGDEDVGGLVGDNRGSITTCYSNRVVKGNRRDVGGLVGYNSGIIATSYSSGMVRGNRNVGGLVGRVGSGSTLHCVWDMEISGLSASAGGVGLTTTEMMDFFMIGLNGFSEDPNWVLNAGLDYPRLAWEGTAGQTIRVPDIDSLDGQGTDQEPYRIATADQLILLSRASALWDKHFILSADIDLDPNLQGKQVFSQAVIQIFSGVFDGNGHTISHLMISGDSYLGMFGQLAPGATVSNLGLEVIDVNGTGDDVGGLVGYNDDGNITNSYSIGTISGDSHVGGLVGVNGGSITTSYSSSSVTGYYFVGGLVGINHGSIATSYSSGAVSGEDYTGGLVGRGSGSMQSVWDMEKSGFTVSDGGVGLTTTEMMDPYTLGLNGFANDPNWILDAGRDYPRLAWEGTAGQIIPEPIFDWLDGQGTAAEPYRIDTADQLILLTRTSALWDKHLILGADIDLDPNLQGRQVFSQAVIQVFSGVFDGNGHAISHLTISGDNYLGLFGQLAPGATVSNLGLEAIDVNGTGSCVGGFVGINHGSIATSYSSGTVSGDDHTGGLVGYNEGYITQSYSTGTVIGDDNVGGLVGGNGGSITNSYSDSTVSGNDEVGGLVGENSGSITSSYSTGLVLEQEREGPEGGLVGFWFTFYGEIVGSTTKSFWDMETSGLTWSAGGTGKTTAEMQTASTFLEAGWDFVDETNNGTEDIWRILEGQGYPRLWWER